MHCRPEILVQRAFREATVIPELGSIPRSVPLPVADRNVPWQPPPSNRVKCNFYMANGRDSRFLNLGFFVCNDDADCVGWGFSERPVILSSRLGNFWR